MSWGYVTCKKNGDVIGIGDCINSSLFNAYTKVCVVDKERDICFTKFKEDYEFNVSCISSTAAQYLKGLKNANIWNDCKLIVEHGVVKYVDE